MRVRSPWVWNAFILAFVLGFAVLEGLALTDPEGLSLSQWYVNITQAFPPIKTLVGIVIGMLITHFGWWWVPRHLHERCEICQRDVLKDSHGG
jgi:sterol desaturase/sphingolipid hydroxylase (fatty acid hydroxylase superfamily)